MGGLRLLDKNRQMASAGGSSDSSHPFLVRLRNLISESPLLEAGLTLFYLIFKLCDLKLAPFFPHPQPVTQGNCMLHSGRGGVVPVASACCQGSCFSCHLSSTGPVVG